MEIRTWQDLRKAASQFKEQLHYLSREFEIAETLGIKVNLEEALADAKTQDERWGVFHKSEEGSDIWIKALTEFMDNATDFQDFRSVMESAPEGSPLQKRAIRAIQKNCERKIAETEDLKTLASAYHEAPDGSAVGKKAQRKLMVIFRQDFESASTLLRKLAIYQNYKRRLSVLDAQSEEYAKQVLLEQCEAILAKKKVSTALSWQIEKVSWETSFGQELREKTLVRILADTRSQKDRWKVYEKADLGSDLRKKAIHQIMDHAKSNQERWKAYEELGRSGVERAFMPIILQSILDHSRTQKARWEVFDQSHRAYLQAPWDNEMGLKAVQAIYDRATTPEELEQICHKMPSDYELYKKALIKKLELL
ncbi:MAG: hypothetical protein V1690_01715 [Candidatus Moraniibacteriota bacterium]